MTRSNFGTVQYVSRGKYRVWWLAETRADGTRKRHSQIINGTLDDAEIALAKKRIGEQGCGTTITYNELWAAKVVPSFTRDKLATKTIEGYERVWVRELKPRIGRDKVAETTCSRAEDILRDIASPWVQKASYILWKKMCNIAIRDGVMYRNPIDKYIKLDAAIAADKPLIDAADVSAWMASIRGIKYESLLLSQCGGGLRPEEACALLREDITPYEYQGKVYALLSVDKALVSTNCGRTLKDTKNRFSRREVVIGAPFAARLLELSCGAGPLCGNGAPHEDGKPWEAQHYSSPTSITNNYRGWCARHGHRYVNPGSLRKSYSVMHGEAGSPDSLVSLSMGHSDGTTRGRNYQRATRRGMMMIADLLADLINGVG